MFLSFFSLTYPRRLRIFVDARDGIGLTQASGRCEFSRAKSDTSSARGCSARHASILTEHFRELQSKSAELKQQVGNLLRNRPKWAN
jgi:hypothetical protein